MFGFGISAYLASVELGYLPHAWEPFFHGGSDVVLHSSIAHALPVPDAVLGAFGYLAEAITGAVGGSRRFDTAPWQPLLYGALALLMALVGATLLVLQPAVIHAACTLCVVSAATSIAIAFNAYPEVRAALRTVRAARRAGRPLGAALRGERSPSIG